ncbi:hypothetical protein BDN72DRAFT_761482 [Pluteus cervinus]|uniref:Uncharacterized protein n=1 Tax=Pluteus cervinus TaxID=181527 RepID=A0ACD3B6K3_9AGAR|nr:hypothetical protein BDN72DRAFT_761482 [Pluteus cervinus]
MSVDPYHEVQQEIETSLQTAKQLRASYVRIRSTAREDSEELEWAKSELMATLATLDADLEALDESVKVVESADARYFGLDDAEVQRRRRYVMTVQRDIQNMRTELTSPSIPTSSSSSSQHQLGISTSTSSSSGGPRTPTRQQKGGHGSASGSLTGGGGGAHEDDDDQSAWAREEQQMIIREQDKTIDSIAGTLSTIAQQASLMGQEIGEHHELLDDLERGVDKTDGKLSDATKKLKKLLRDSEEKGSGWCIAILIVVLIALLLAVILV